MVSSSKWESVNQLKGGLIVSCQASTGEPLCKPEHILALSLSALNGGAIALRLEGAENIRFVRQSKMVPAKLPLIGLTKRTLDDPADYIRTAYITSTFAEAREIADAGRRHYCPGRNRSNKRGWTISRRNGQADPQRFAQASLG